MFYSIGLYISWKITKIVYNVFKIIISVIILG